MLRRDLMRYLTAGVILGGVGLVGRPVRLGAAIRPPQLAENAAPPLFDDDMILGKADAPVTIIEYASLTCPHCAHFSTTTFPKVRSELIEPGKVRWVYRDLPLDHRALLGALLVHCMPKEQYFATIDVLFATQDDWASAANANAALGQIGRTAGLDQPTVDKCLANKAMTAKIIARIKDGEQKYDIKATPTFIIDGKGQSGDMTYDAFFDLVKNLLPKP
jgi:protein-disulfide isomerase